MRSSNTRFLSETAVGTSPERIAVQNALMVGRTAQPESTKPRELRRTNESPRHRCLRRLARRVLGSRVGGDSHDPRATRSWDRTARQASGLSGRPARCRLGHGYGLPTPPAPSRPVRSAHTRGACGEPPAATVLLRAYRAHAFAFASGDT